MKSAVFSIAAAALCFAAHAVTDVYGLTMRLRVPQVENNSESTGKRVYQTQKLNGVMEVAYSTNGQATVSVTGITNSTFKIRGVKVTYDTLVEGSRWNLVGNNRTGVFKKPSVWLSVEMTPSYVAAYEPTEDNSLVLYISGTGSSVRSISGYAAGHLGCGCSDYGHTSPTRAMGAFGPLPLVEDVAAVHGVWTAKRIGRRESD